MVHLTGDEAREASRPYTVFMGLSFALIAVSLLLAWWLLDYQFEQLTFLGIAVACLVLSVLVFQFGAIAVAYSSGEGGQSLDIWPAPEPRWLTGSALVTVGLVMAAGSTESNIGSFFRPVGRLGVTVWSFGSAAWGLLVSLVVIVFAVGALGNKDDRGPALVLLGLVGFAALVNLGVYLVAPGFFDRAWDDFLQPFREMWDAVH